MAILSLFFFADDYNWDCIPHTLYKQISARTIETLSAILFITKIHDRTTSTYNLIIICLLFSNVVLKYYLKYMLIESIYIIYIYKRKVTS